MTPTLSAADGASVDPLDLQLDRSGVTVAPLSHTAPPSVLRWPVEAFPALLLVAGVALGPYGLAILTPAVLAFVDPAIPVALAVFGVVAGLHVRVGRGHTRLFAAAQAQSLVTAMTVAIAVSLIAPADGAAGSVPPWWVVIMVLAAAAATSAPLASADEGPSPALSHRIDLDDCLVPIVAGGIAMAFMRAQPPLASVSLVAQMAIVAAVIAGAAWMLLAHAGAPEQRVFAFGTLLLAGGSADYVGASPLLAGFIAGVCWRRATGAVREHIRRDVAYVQHSLLVLVLLVAGASATFTRAAWLLALVYVLARSGGKLAGGWLAARVGPRISGTARIQLVSPGVFGVAFALSVMRAAGPALGPVVTVVVIGTIVSSLIAALAARETDA